MKSFGQIAYEGYCVATGWKSLISGATLPQFSALAEDIKVAWESAAKNVIEVFLADTPPEAEG